MAEKISDSIRRKVKGLKKMLHGAPTSAPAPKESPRGQRSTTAAKDPAAEEGPPGTPEAKPDKKRLTPQPWYRHRQRW
jgi:hypothetical protein